MKPLLPSIRAALASLLTPGPRMLDEAECVVSVLLAIGFAHWLGATHVYWAAFSALVLMRGHVSQTLLRGLLRVIGTIMGAIVAVILVPVAAGNIWLAAICAAYACIIGLYGMMAAKRGYAWFLYGLTIVLVLLDKIEHPDLETTALATTRLLEVVAGTLACVLVSAVTTFTARRIWPAPPADKPPETRWRPDVARHVALAGATLALLPIIHSIWPLPELEQAGVTIMAVMILPLSALQSRSIGAVGHRIVNRLAGCLAGGAFGAAVLFVAHGSALALILGTCIGVMLGRHIENSATTAKYAGLQFTLAAIVVLVPDSYADISVQPGIERLASIFVGMALLLPVLLLWHLARRKRAAR